MPFAVNGNFNGWWGSCNALGDADGDGVWTGSVWLLANDDANPVYEYKFTMDVNNWETLTEGDSCTLTTTDDSIAARTVDHETMSLGLNNAANLGIAVP